MTQSQPSPYASVLMLSGSPSSEAFTSTTVPPTGAYTCETDLVDSTSPSSPPRTTLSPTEGSWTNTMSPRASCAKSVRPTLTLASSRRAHSWSAVYLRSCGISISHGSFGAAANFNASAIVVTRRTLRPPVPWQHRAAVTRPPISWSGCSFGKDLLDVIGRPLGPLLGLGLGSAFGLDASDRRLRIG